MSARAPVDVCALARVEELQHSDAISDGGRTDGVDADGCARALIADIGAFLREARDRQEDLLQRQEYVTQALEAHVRTSPKAAHGDSAVTGADATASAISPVEYDGTESNTKSPKQRRSWSDNILLPIAGNRSALARNFGADEQMDQQASPGDSRQLSPGFAVSDGSALTPSGRSNCSSPTGKLWGNRIRSPHHAPQPYADESGGLIGWNLHRGGSIGAEIYEVATPEYDLANYYYTTGRSQALVRSSYFQDLTFAVISINTIYIGIELELSGAVDSNWAFVVCDQLFCLFFLFELSARFLAFQKKRDALSDTWFLFDSALLGLMVVETWIVPAAGLLGLTGVGGSQDGPVRLLRVLRVLRMGRLIKRLPELLGMIHGVKKAGRGVFAAFLLLMILIYVFSIILHAFLDEEEAVEKYFTGLPTVMLTLLIDGTFLDGVGTVMRALLEAEKYPSFCIFLLFVACSAMTVMNMLIGVLCEVVSQTSNAEKEEAAVSTMKATLLVELMKKDLDGSGFISEDEWNAVMEDEHARAVLEDMNVDVEYVLDVGRTLYDRFEDVSIGMTMELMLAARGGRQLTMKDLINSNQFMFWKLERKLDLLEASFTRLSLQRRAAPALRGVR